MGQRIRSDSQRSLRGQSGPGWREGRTGALLLGTPRQWLWPPEGQGASSPRGAPDPGKAGGGCRTTTPTHPLPPPPLARGPLLGTIPNPRRLGAAPAGLPARLAPTVRLRSASPLLCGERGRQGPERAAGKGAARRQRLPGPARPWGRARGGGSAAEGLPGRSTSRRGPAAAASPAGRRSRAPARPRWRSPGSAWRPRAGAGGGGGRRGRGRARARRRRAEAGRPRRSGGSCCSYSRSPGAARPAPSASRPWGTEAPSPPPSPQPLPSERGPRAHARLPAACCGATAGRAEPRREAASQGRSRARPSRQAAAWARRGPRARLAGSRRGRARAGRRRRRGGRARVPSAGGAGGVRPAPSRDSGIGRWRPRPRSGPCLEGCPTGRLQRRKRGPRWAPALRERGGARSEPRGKGTNLHPLTWRRPRWPPPPPAAGCCTCPTGAALPGLARGLGWRPV